MRGPAAVRLGLLLGLVTSGNALAQEQERPFCEDTPANGCPGADCLCVDDTLEVVFEADLTSSIFEYGTLPAEGLRVTSLVAAEVVSGIRGWSFGVLHDPSLLSLSLADVTTAGTDGSPAVVGGFIARRVFPEGYVVATVINVLQPGVVLPPGRATLIKATYTLGADAGTQGTPLRLTESLGTPPTQVIFTVDSLEFPPMVDRDEGNCINGVDDDRDGLTDRDDDDCIVRNGVSRVPRRLTDGLIRRRAAAAAPFRRGDADGNARVNITDAILLVQAAVGNLEPRFRCDDLRDTTDDGRLDLTDGVALLRHIFQRGPPPPAPFGACEDDPTPEALSCEQSNC